MSQAGFEPTNPLFKDTKTVRVLDCAATLIGKMKNLLGKIEENFAFKSGKRFQC
jgi:hypothetical protein